MKYRVTYLALLYLSLGQLAAESLIMNSGRVIIGQVIDHDASIIKIKTTKSVETISKKKVFKILYTTDRREINKALSRERGNLIRRQRLSASRNRERRRIRNKESSIAKEKTNSKITRMNRKIILLEQRLKRLTRKIERLRKNLK
ncbi:MAG: hypothetical protein AAF518_05770 [Spirochaetota bacterium]